MPLPVSLLAAGKKTFRQEKPPAPLFGQIRINLPHSCQMHADAGGVGQTRATRWCGGGGGGCPRWLAAHPAARHWGHLFLEQLLAVLPITVLLVASLAIYFHRQITDPASAFGGLAAAVFGLVLFLEGLRVAVMPLSAFIGEGFPRMYPLWVTLLLNLGLGMLVTYAEPSIQALRPLAELVDPARAPYLYFMLKQQLEQLILAVAVGVGLAAVLGTLRFVHGWSLKPLIAGCLAPTIALALYMHFGNPQLRPLIGLAWDCGAVTTGSVSCPLLLQLGYGVMKSQRHKHGGGGGGKAATVSKLEGFGIVTLASLLPILTVEVLCIIIGATYSSDEIIAHAAAAAVAASIAPPFHARALAPSFASALSEGMGAMRALAPSPAASSAPSSSTSVTSMLDSTPLQEIVFSIRAVAPLAAALLLIVVVFMRAPLPHLSFAAPLPADHHSHSNQQPHTGGESGGGGVEDFSTAGSVALGGGSSIGAKSGGGGSAVLSSAPFEGVKEGGEAVRRRAVGGAEIELTGLPHGPRLAPHVADDVPASVAIQANDVAVDVDVVEADGDGAPYSPTGVVYPVLSPSPHIDMHPANYYDAVVSTSPIASPTSRISPTAREAQSHSAFPSTPTASASHATTSPAIIDSRNPLASSALDAHTAGASAPYDGEADDVASVDTLPPTGKANLPPAFGGGGGGGIWASKSASGDDVIAAVRAGSSSNSVGGKFGIVVGDTGSALSFESHTPPGAPTTTPPSSPYSNWAVFLSAVLVALVSMSEGNERWCGGQAYY